MNVDMYGRAELALANTTPMPAMPAGAALDAIARTADGLVIAVSVFGSTTRHELLRVTDAATTRIGLPTRALATFHHRGRVIVLGVDLVVHELIDGALVARSAIDGSPPRPEGPHPAARLESEACWALDATSDALSLYFVWCGYDGTAAAHFREGHGWSSLPPLEARLPVSMAVWRGTPLVASSVAVKHREEQILHRLLDGAWTRVKPMLAPTFSKGAMKPFATLRIRNDDRGDVVGQHGVDALVRMDDRMRFVMTAAKWQLPSTGRDLVEAETWATFTLERDGLVERHARLEPLPISAPTPTRKPQKITLPASRFFDGSLLARGAHLYAPHFVDDERVLVFGSTRSSLVVHDIRRVDGAWTPVRRHSIPLVMPHVLDGFGVHHSYALDVHQRGDVLFVSFSSPTHHQITRFDLDRSVFSDLGLSGGGQIAYRVDETYVVIPALDTRGPLVLVSLDGERVSTSESLSRDDGVVSHGEWLYALQRSRALAFDLGGRVVRTWALPEAREWTVAVADGEALSIALRDGRRVRLERDGSVTESEARDVAPPPPDWQFCGLDVKSGFPEPTRLVTPDGETRFVLDFKSQSRNVYVLSASPSGRSWAVGDIKSFEYLDLRDGTLSFAPKGKEPSTEERAEALYPGFLAGGRARFASWQLGVSVYESLVSAGLAEPFSLETFASVFSKKIDTERMALVKDAAQCVAYLADSHPRLAELTSLHHEVNGNEIHNELYPQWDGEDDTFAITSLRGIESCVGLVDATFRLTGPKSVDVSPLAALPKLERLALHGSITGVAKLARSPSLRELVIDDGIEGTERLDARVNVTRVPR